MMDRKEFLFGIAGAISGLVALACGGGDSSGSPSGQGNGNCNDGIDVTITSNHGHVLRVEAADVSGAQSKTYSIKGTSSHDHTVTISAQDFADLGAGKKVTKTSSNDAGHSHPIEVIC